MAKAEDTTKGEHEGVPPEGEIPEAPAPEITAEAAAIDQAKHDARAREEARQAEVVAAVAEAGASELPKLGGSFENPGLGR